LSTGRTGVDFGALPSPAETYIHTPRPGLRKSLIDFTTYENKIRTSDFRTKGFADVTI